MANKLNIAETPKQKAIRDAYGKHYESLKEYIWPADGALDKDVFTNESISYDDISDIGFTHTEHFCTPKSLSGIGNNNGWITILPDGSNVPKEEGNYFVHSTYINNPYYSFRIDIFTGRLTNATHHETGKQLFTHYQPIEKPNPPIY